MCGCRKGVKKKVSTASVRAAGISAGPANQLRSQAVVPISQVNVAALSAERRKTQNLRRDAIRKALNK